MAEYDMEHTGEELDEAVEIVLSNYAGSVRYDTTQYLTDEQKAAARENIGTGKVDETLTGTGDAAEAGTTGANISEIGEKLAASATVNKLDQKDIVFGYYFKSTGLTTTTTTTSGISTAIRVKANTTYRFYAAGGTFGYNQPKLGFYTTPYDPLHPSSIISASAVSGETRQWTFTPSADGWVRINMSSTWTGTTCLCEAASWIRSDVPYTPMIVRNPLYGKSIACDGASIMRGNESFVGGYVRLIAEANGMSYINNAVGGANIAVPSDAYQEAHPNNHKISMSLPELPAGYDFYLFDGAANDHESARGISFSTEDYPPLESNSYPTEGYELTIFNRAFEYCCMTLATASKFREAKCGYIFPHRKSTATWWTGTWKPFMEATLQKWGIPYLDLEKLLPPIGLIEDLKSAYTVSADGTHPTKECYVKFYQPIITEWLKSL